MGSVNVNRLSLLFLMGILFHIYFFVLNDYGDLWVDKLSKDLKKKPLVSGDISPKSALVIALLAALIIYVFTIIFLLSFFTIVFLSLALIFGGLYDFYGKRVTGYGDFLVAIPLSLLFLFGASTVSNFFNNTVIITGFLIFFTCVVGNAVEGGLKDVDHDSSDGGKTLATMMGVKVIEGKLIITNLFRVFSYSFIGICLFFLVLLGLQPEINLFVSDYLRTAIVILLLIIALIGAIALLHLKVFDRVKIKRLYTVINSAAGALLLITMMPVLGLVLTLTLILIPISWYIVFNVAIYGKPFQPLV